MGTGREAFAECIHTGSLLKDFPCISINFATIPDQEAARILFGIEYKENLHIGLLEQASHGTLIIKNLYEATPVVQAYLADVLDNQKLIRIGGKNYNHVNFRPITILTDNPNVGCGIRPELVYRLSVIELKLPPLRDRLPDMEKLFPAYFSYEVNLQRKIDISQEMVELLCFNSWPGNLHELSAVCKRYALRLHRNIKMTATAKYLALIQAIGEDRLLAEIYRQYPAMSDISHATTEQAIAGIEATKRILRYNNQMVAEKLNISRTSLWRTLKKE